ncbi:MAG TPA: fluoride efflux transporter CrcB [Candidatus Deferrimicrobium sp.]|nr:fluoride efflux transporter CrcB [Candidatus Deferrimicrobium sp.]
MNIALVILGGALGALARYEVGNFVGARWNHGFPLGTFIINIVGCFLLGMINVFVLERTILSPEWRIGLGVGFMGAFTTFSTFSYEAVVLLEEGSHLLALGYLSLSMIVGLLATFLGILIARTI